MTTETHSKTLDQEPSGTYEFGDLPIAGAEIENQVSKLGNEKVGTTLQTKGNTMSAR
jgi:hypothetical protein